MRTLNNIIYMPFNDDVCRNVAIPNVTNNEIIDLNDEDLIIWQNPF